MRDEFPALTKALIAGARFFSPDLDKCIEKEQRARAGLEALMKGLSEWGKTDTAREESTKQGLHYEPPSEQFRRSDSFLSDPFSASLGMPKTPTAPASKGGLKRADERISELLEILWADVLLWKSVAKYMPPEDIAAFIRRRYGLKFPPLPVAVWQQMVWQPQKRETLFNLLHIGFNTEVDWGALRELGQKLPPKLAGELLFKYFYSPGSDHTNVLASQNISLHALAYMRKAVVKLLKNISWCEQNPGLIPPDFAPAPRHRSKDVERVRKIEEMVKRLLENPALSDYELAGGVDALRKVAANARQLVELREREAVKRYSELRDGRIFGRKPRQRH